MIQGPMSEPGRETFTNYGPVPVRHGMTLGELAQMFNAEHNIHAKLTVVPMQGWMRGDWFDETGLDWTNPSPNLRSLTETTLLSPALRWSRVRTFRSSCAGWARDSSIPRPFHQTSHPASILAWDDRELRVNVVLGVEHLRQFAQGHSVSDGNWAIVSEILASRFGHRSLDNAPLRGFGRSSTTREMPALAG